MDIIQTVHIVTEPTRFRLLQLLFEHGYCVRALSKKIGISESAVSQHLAILRKCNIVHGTKIGYQVHYRVDKPLLVSFFSQLAQQFSKYPDEKGPSWSCSCEYIAECIRNDAKTLEEARHAK